MVECFLFLPQVRLSVGDITERARHAEDSGFDGIAFIDHLEAPGLPGESIWEAMGIATWVAANRNGAAARIGPSGSLRRLSASCRPRQTSRHPLRRIGRQIRARPRCGILAR